eukprot:1161058-Pelagomonas_calceolata.AAC.3
MRPPYSNRKKHVQAPSGSIFRSRCVPCTHLLGLARMPLAPVPHAGRGSPPPPLASGHAA